jgi:hypothetical protein
MAKNTVWVIIGIVLLVLLVWGLIGSSKVADAGFSCDFGIDNQGSVFCWQWHKNLAGEVGDVLDNLFNK